MDAAELGFESAKEGGQPVAGNDGGKAWMRQVWGYQRRDEVSRMHRLERERCQAWQRYAILVERGIVGIGELECVSLSHDSRDGSVSGPRR